MDEKNELEKNSINLDISDEIVPDIEIPNLRTFKNDVSQNVSKNNVTPAKILMAEQKKKLLENNLETSNKSKTLKNTFVALASIILLVASAGIVVYFGYLNKKDQVPIANPQATAFLFVYENEKFIDVSDTKEEIWQEIEKIRTEVSQGSANTYTELVFFQTDEATETNNRIDALSFLRLFEISIPISIARSFSQDFSYGFYNNEGRAEPFLVVGLVDYETAYADMFLWERTLALDIKTMFPVLTNLFDISNIKAVPVEVQATSTASTTTDVATTTTATTTGTSTLQQINEQEIVSDGTSTSETTVPTEESSAPLLNEQDEVERINRQIKFSDVIISNYNTRAVRNENGSPFFYYAFLDKDKLLFAQDPKLVGEIIRKMKQRQLVR